MTDREKIILELAAQKARDMVYDALKNACRCHGELYSYEIDAESDDAYSAVKSIEDLFP
jgi:hypothetical protein